MIVDGRSVGRNEVLETDVCIIGGGVAGLTLAHELRGQPFRVVLIESGGFRPDAETTSLYQGEDVGIPSPGVYIGRLRFFGGTSNHWGGTRRPLDPVDFERRDWVPYSGWPFSREALDPYYERAHLIIHLGPPRYDPGFWAHSSGRAFDAGLKTEQIVLKLFQVRPLRFGQIYRDVVQRASNITVYLHSNATEIQTSHDANRATRVAVACLQGPRFFVSAKIFILATGGIENARVLLLSNKRRPAGLGNDHDLVGRFLMDHPGLFSGRFVPANPATIGWSTATCYADALSGRPAA